MRAAPPDPEGETELVRWFENLAATTTIDPHAWDKIQAGIAAGTPGAPPKAAPRALRPPRAPRAPRRLALAVAAVLLIVLSAAVAVSRSDHGHVRTGDGPRGSEDDRSSTSRPGGDASTSTSTTSSPPPRPDTPGSAGSGPGDGPGPIAGTTPPDASGPGGAAAPDPDTPPPRAAPAAVLPMPGYTVEVIQSPDTLWFRRTDDVGSQPGGPDGYGYINASAVGGASPTPYCLTSGGGYDERPGFDTDTFIYGLYGSEIYEIFIVMANGDTYSVGLYANQPGQGLWVWMTAIGEGPVDLVRAVDVNGTVVSVIDLDGGYEGSAQC